MPTPYPIPQGPVPPPGTPPGPHDPPSPPPRRVVVDDTLPCFRYVPNVLGQSAMYPDLMSWWPGETASHGFNPPVAAVVR